MHDDKRPSVPCSVQRQDRITRVILLDRVLDCRQVQQAWRPPGDAGSLYLAISPTPRLRYMRISLTSYTSRGSLCDRILSAGGSPGISLVWGLLCHILVSAVTQIPDFLCRFSGVHSPNDY